MDVESIRRRVQPVTDGYPELRGRLAPARERIRSRFEIDTRALAALRIALGLIILLDLLHRAGDAGVFYTDHGVYPVAAYEATYDRFTGLSIHAASGALWFQGLLFAVAGLFAIALILGYRTRLVALVSFGLLFSLHARNPIVLNGADRLLRVLLLVALVTPLGERWSIDALRRGEARTTVVGFATAALLVQPLVVFLQNAIQKHRGETWYAGDALELVFANEIMTVYLGNYLGAYPTLLEVLNWAWVLLLSGSVVFLLVTDGRLRALFALAYIGAFGGMLVTLSVGLFPLVLTASVIPYLTAPFWDWLARRMPSRWAERRPTGASFGPIGRPPVERRLLDTLRQRGYESTASFALAYCQSLLTIVGLLVLTWILLFGATHVTEHDVPDGIDHAALNEQRWGLYAPDPSESYGWYVVEAELEDGSSVDAFGGGDVVMDRPPDGGRAYETFRHRKYMNAVGRSGLGERSDVIAERYADWACERADSVHDGRVERVTVHWLYRSSLDGADGAPNRLTVVERAC